MENAQDIRAANKPFNRTYQTFQHRNNNLNTIHLVLSYPSHPHVHVPLTRLLLFSIFIQPTYSRTIHCSKGMMVCLQYNKTKTKEHVAFRA
ncbi:hypothetical protein VTL71DRAFT_14764 [Oculimacula yallundae]|uniref:Uncharacterized protein n=1 Tax=Oculimacula yallundae TaxID=86028 RepID=A0ABR4CLP0_9HELO